jgi:hypothetical protein
MSLSVRPKSARDHSQSAATTMATLDQTRFLAIHFATSPASVIARGVANGALSTQTSTEPKP